MKQEFREIIENEFDCLLHDVDFVIKKEGTLQSVINCMNQVKNNGVLADVSNRRKLLIAFLFDFVGGDKQAPIDEWADSFLERNKGNL